MSSNSYDRISELLTKLTTSNERSLTRRERTETPPPHDTTRQKPPTGHQMALCFEIATLVLLWLLMDALGLTRVWLNTEKAKSVSFAIGQTTDYCLRAESYEKTIDEEEAELRMIVGILILTSNQQSRKT